MSYLAFKEKMNRLKNNEIERDRFFQAAQVAGVGLFWIALIIALLICGHRTEVERTSNLNEKAILY